MKKQPVTYRVLPVVLVEDDILHTPERPTCDDANCPCWDDYRAQQAEQEPGSKEVEAA